MWVFLKLFVEDNDNGIDLLTKFQLDPVWHLRDKIKAPVHFQLALETQVGVFGGRIDFQDSIWILSSCLRISCKLGGHLPKGYVLKNTHHQYL
jgi:hypothetical protein